MIVVTVELHSAITGKVTVLGKAVVANDGTGTPARGNYVAYIGRGGQSDIRAIINKPQKIKRVRGFARRSLSAWELLRRALNAPKETT